MTATRMATTRRVLAVALLVGATMLARPAVDQAHAVDSAVGSGAYVGAGAPARLANFERWRGRPTAFAVDFLATDDWSKIHSPTWWLNRWSAAGAPLVLAVPMLPNDPRTTLEAGAAGHYDEHFRRLGDYLVGFGYADVTLRVGWEMNGDWYRWSAAADPERWKAYYRRIVSALRSAPGQHFTFDWSVSLGSAAMPADLAYPGDAYVDYVGVDVYDWKWGDAVSTPAERWEWIVNQDHGLSWAAAFAARHGKRLTVPEWGLAARAVMHNGGGGDNPLFVRRMVAWQRSNRVVYESYFNDATSRIDTGAFPAAAATYRDLAFAG